ncbi:MAG: hypothetical protein GXO39_04630 [Thermotogae bacterium]|nr:hypothetical protein [Thermotogota bacterium]
MPLFTWVIILGGNYEGGLSPWVVANGGGPTTWTLGVYGERGYEPPTDGSNYAVCDASSDEIYSDTLLSPVLPVAGYDSLILVFSYAFNKESYLSGDGAQVLVRYHDGIVWNSWIILRNYATTSRGIDTLVLDAGYDSLQIAFLYSSPDRAYWFAVDGVKVLGLRRFSYDMAADSILVPAGIHYVGQFIAPTVTLTNLGDSSVSLDFYFLVTYRGDTVYHQLGNFIAESGSSYTLDMPWFIPESLGLYRSILVVIADTDEYHGNDTLKDSFLVRPYPTTILSVPHAPPIHLDGTIQPSEWGSAYRLDVSNYFGVLSDPTDTGVVVLLLQHDGSNLNLAVLTGDTTQDSTDALYIFLDDDGDRIWEIGEGLNRIDGRFYIGWATKDEDGTVVLPRRDMLRRFARSGGVYEISLPLGIFSHDDPAKLKRRVGQHFGMFLIYRDGRTGKFLAWWPQTMEGGDPDTLRPANTYLVLEKPTPWHDMGIGGIILPKEGCLSGKLCRFGVSIFENASTLMEVETLKVLIKRDATPLYMAQAILNTTPNSFDTLWFSWIPPDSGLYTVEVTLSEDNSPGNDTALAVLNAFRPITPPYTQDFEGVWPPTGWWVEGRGWFKGNYLADHHVAPSFGASGENFAEFLSFVLPSGWSSALHIPPIAPGVSAHLSLWVWNGPTWSGRGNYDRLDIYYKEAQSDIWYPLASIFGDMAGWKRYTFNLPSVSDTLYIKLVARSDYGDTDLSIDRVELLPGLSVLEDHREKYCLFEGSTVLFRGHLRIYGTDGRLILSAKSREPKRLELPSYRGVMVLVCNREVMKAISPLK